MRDQILRLYAMTLAEAEKLSAAVPCERCAELPYPDAKHPAWVLSHLALGSGMMVGLLRGDANSFGCVPASWAAFAAPGAPVVGDRGAYPTKEAALSTLRAVHAELAEAYRGAPDAVLASEFPDPAYRAFFPTLGDAAAYLMAHHEGYHLGQMSQWRRAAGFSPLADAT